MNKTMRFGLFLFLLPFLILAFPAPATAKNPQNKAETLQRLEAEKQNRDVLAGKLKNAEKKLQAAKADLVKAAESVRANEELLLALDGRMKALTEEEKDLGAKLESDHAAMASLILALERIRRVPPDALIVRPGAPLQTAQSALLLRTILPGIHKRAATLALDLDRLTSIRETLKADRERALQAKATLKNKYSEIEALADERETLYRNLNSDYQETAAAIERLAQEAESMQDFLVKLEDNTNRRQAGAQARRGLESIARALPLPRFGEARLPVSGAILTGYGEKDKIGATSQGLSIKGSPGGLVVAPMGGVVRYAGEFKNYGRLVILEHKDNYHSLIGGMEDINIAVGQKLDAGEPVGKLPDNASRGGNPTLYYELRHKGQPVNPSAKLSNLKS